MGLDLGFEKRGFDIKVCLDNDPWAIKTIAANRPNIPLITRDIFEVSTEDILSAAILSVGEATAVIGGPPCQPFSSAGKRLSMADNRAKSLREFTRVVVQAQPLFFILENVASMLWISSTYLDEPFVGSSLRHTQHNRLGTAFCTLLGLLESTGYTLSWAVLNAADYGVPQIRKRLFVIGSREGMAIPFLLPTHGTPADPRVQSGVLAPWVTLREAFSDLHDPWPEYLLFPQWRRYLKYVPQGGCWRDLPSHLQKEALGGAFDTQGGKTSFFRRLSWDRPAPTLVTSPIYKGSPLCHPAYDRPLSVNEYARLQGFPADWQFPCPLRAKYRLIGNAVPVLLAAALAASVLYYKV
jgi:DNA (cytosine-5)-methyltransferase 1